MTRAGRAQRQTFDVFLDDAHLGIACKRVGRMHRHASRTDLAASFENDPDWLGAKTAFMPDPRRSLYRGEQYPPERTHAFGLFLDSSPDRWGRMLMDRREAGAQPPRSARCASCRKRTSCSACTTLPGWARCAFVRAMAARFSTTA